MSGSPFISRLLLWSGVIAAMLYISMDLIAASFLYPGYNITSQQMSELSAIGAPSRPFWLALGYLYGLLTLAFATGVWRTSSGKPSLRIAALMIALLAINGISWGLVAPMHMRGTEFTTSDTLHIAFAVSAVAIILGMITAGATALGVRFRFYSLATVVAMLTAGAVVSTQVSAIAAGEPTPWMGLVERISVYGPTVWMIVFAMTLLRRHPSAEAD